MKRTVIVFCLAWLGSSILFSQNLPYVKSMIDTLASPEFYGRGYVNNGDKIAAAFIAKQLKKDQVKCFDTSYFQIFHINVNTFPDDVALKINGVDKQPGVDFMVSPDAQTMKDSYKILLVDGNTLSSEKLTKKFNNQNHSKLALVVDTGFKDLKNKKLEETPLLVFIRDKGISWHVAQEQNEKKHAEITINRSALPEKITNISVNIHAKLLSNYPSQNVVGYIPGKIYPDSFVVFGAHYDHLGMIGNKAYFPGANDNASGTAMLLDLAAYYAQPENRPDYSVCFIFFSGEEAGLVGSEYYTKFPLFPLRKIKFMLNLDMVGTGSDGIKVVNGSIFKKEFETLKQLNEAGKYLKSVNERGEAANSDHYYFYKKGVKSFFIYTLGTEYKEYHTVTDKAAGLPLTKYSELFNLILHFVSSL